MKLIRQKEFALSTAAKGVIGVGLGAVGGAIGGYNSTRKLKDKLRTQHPEMSEEDIDALSKTKTGLRVAGGALTGAAAGALAVGTLNGRKKKPVKGDYVPGTYLSDSIRNRNQRLRNRRLFSEDEIDNLN